MFGSRLLTHSPDCPRCLNSQGPLSSVGTASMLGGNAKGKWLAIVAGQQWLVIKRINMAGTAMHEQENDAADSRRHMRLRRPPAPPNADRQGAKAGDRQRTERETADRAEVVVAKIRCGCCS